MADPAQIREASEDDFNRLVYEAQELRNYLLRAGEVPQIDLIEALMPFEAPGATATPDQRMALYVTFQRVKRRLAGKVDDYTLNSVLHGKSPFRREAPLVASIAITAIGVLLVWLAVYFTNWSNRASYILVEAEGFTSFDHFNEITRLVEQAMNYHNDDAAVIDPSTGQPVSVAAGRPLDAELLSFFERVSTLKRHYIDEQTVLEGMVDHMRRINPVVGPMERLVAASCPEPLFEGVGPTPTLTFFQRFLRCAEPIAFLPPPETEAAMAPEGDGDAPPETVATQPDPGDPGIDKTLASGEPDSVPGAEQTDEGANGSGVTEAAASSENGGQDAAGLAASTIATVPDMGFRAVLRSAEELEAFREMRQIALAERRAQEAAGRQLRQDYASVVQVVQGYGERLRGYMGTVSHTVLPIIYGMLGSIVYCMWRILNPAVSSLGFWYTLLRTSFAGLGALTLSMLIVPSNLLALSVEVTRPFVYLLAFVFGYAIESLVSLLNGLNRVLSNMVLPDDQREGGEARLDRKEEERMLELRERAAGEAPRPAPG